MQGGLEGGLERGGGRAEGAGGEAGGGDGWGAGELEAWVMLERELEGGAENCWKGTGGGGEIGKKAGRGGQSFWMGTVTWNGRWKGGKSFPRHSQRLEGVWRGDLRDLSRKCWKGTGRERPLPDPSPTFSVQWKKGIRALGYNTENQDVTIKMAALSSNFHSLQDTHFDEDPAFNLRTTAADEPQNQVSFIFITPASDDGMCILLYPEYDQTGVSGPSESVPVYVKQGELLLLRWDVAHAGTFAVLMNKRTPMIRLHGKAYIRGGRVPDVQPTNYYHDANGNELRQFYKVTEVVKSMFGPSTREAQSFGESVVTTLPEDFDGPPLDLFARPQWDIPSCLSPLKPNVSPSKKYVPFLTTQPSPNHGRPATKSDCPLDGTGIGGSQIIFDNAEKHAPDTKHKCDQVSTPQVVWIF